MHRTRMYSKSISPILIQCSTDEDMEYLGEQIADYCDKGDVLLLTGDLGAGKTTISRGLIRKKLGDNYLRVTSPTYLLDNIYQYDDTKIIHHFDLYRLPSGADVKVLGIPEVYRSSLCLIEWSQRLNSSDRPDNYLGIDIRISPDTSRLVQLTPYGLRWMEKLTKLLDSIKNDESEDEDI